MNMILDPAYGRDYRSAREVKERWEDGTDFVIASIGPNMGYYINLQDCKETGIKEVTIRFKKLTNFVIIKIK